MVAISVPRGLHRAHGAALVIYLLLLVLLPRTANGTIGISLLQEGAIWPMAGRNQYHSGQSPFGQTNSHKDAHAGTIAWSVKLSATAGPANIPNSAGPVIGNDGTVYVGCNDGYMYAVEPASKKIRWQFLAGGAIQSTALLAGRSSDQTLTTLYFGCSDSNVYALNAGNGTKLWSYTTSNSIRGSPVTDSSGNVYFPVTDGSIWKFSPQGALLWTYGNKVWSRATSSNLAMYLATVADGKDKEHLLYLATGTDGQYAVSIYNILEDDVTQLIPEIYAMNKLRTAASLSSPVIDMTKESAFIASEDSNTLNEMVLVDDRLVANPIQCCGGANIALSMCTASDPKHVCNVMGASYTTPALRILPDGRRQLYWGNFGEGLSTKSDSNRKPYFYSYDFTAAKLGGGEMSSQYELPAAVQGAAVVDKNGVVYAPLVNGDIIAFYYGGGGDALTYTATGTPPLWSFTLPGVPAIYSSLAISAEGYVVVLSNDGVLYGISPASSGTNKLVYPTCPSGQGVVMPDVSDAGAGPVPWDGTTDCMLCSEGHYNAGAGVVCAPCLSGKFAIDVGTTVCIDCGTGTYASNFGSTACAMCPLGSFSAAAGLSSCVNCLPGSYAGVYGKTSCDACIPGKSSLAGASACTDCIAGTYADSIGQPACKSCAKGFYTDLSRSTACTPCRAGTSSSADMTTCVACPAGQYADTFGSDCLKCPLGSTSAADRRSCLPCSWPKFTSSTGQPTCDSYVAVPWSSKFDKSSILVLAVILGATSIFYCLALVCVEVTSDDEMQCSGSVVTIAGVALWLFPTNAALLSIVLYTLTKNYSTLGTFAANLLVLLMPAAPFANFLHTYHVIPYGSSDVAEKPLAAARVRAACLKALNFFLVVLPWGLVGLGCYVSRALSVKRVWNAWYRQFTGKTYFGTYEKFNSRFLNTCNIYAIQMHLLPQLVIVVVSEVTSNFTLLGIMTIAILVCNIAIIAKRQWDYGGNLDAPIDLHFSAFDVTFLHVDVSVMDEGDDAPIEQGMVRAAVIFNGEEITESGFADIPRRGEIAMGMRQSAGQGVDPTLLNLGGLLTLTHFLIVGQEDLPTAQILPLGRATRIFEAVPAIPAERLGGGGGGGGGGAGSSQFTAFGPRSVFGSRAVVRTGIMDDPRNYADQDNGRL